jgi:hypothetical protein
LSDDFCPFKIVLPTDRPVSLLPSYNTANLKRIVFNIHNPVLLRVLLCKEEKNTQHSTECLYPDHRNSDAINLACNVQDKLAHIYVRHEDINNTVRSCVIVFIEAMYLYDKDGLLNLYKNTVRFLEIANEKPYLYVLRDGASLINNTTFKALNIEIRNYYGDHSNDEDICKIIPVEIHSELLRIDYTDTFYVIPQ